MRYLENRQKNSLPSFAGWGNSISENWAQLQNP